MKRQFCLILLSILFLAGCGKENDEVLIRKSTIEIENKLTFMIPWPESTERGNKLKNLVNNYNLRMPEEDQIVLVMSSDPYSYEDEIKKLAAVNQLPDIFILKDNTEGKAIQDSGKLLNFFPYLEMLSYEEFAAEKDLTKNQILKIGFEQPTFRLYYNREAADKYGYPFISDSAKLLYKLFELIEKNQFNEKAGSIQNKAGALDFLYYLTAQAVDFDKYNTEQWENCIRQWKRYYWFMDYQEDKNRLIKTKEDYPDCFISDSTFSSVFDNELILKSVLLSDGEGSLIRTETLNWAGAKQNNKETEEKIVNFISYLLESKWLDEITAPSENAFEEFGSPKERLLESREIPLKMKNDLIDLLNRLLGDEITDQEAAVHIVKLHEEYGI